MHATPGRIHHAVVGRGLLRYVSVSSSRDVLTAAVDRAMKCWSGAALAASIDSGEFVASLAELAPVTGIGTMIPHLPSRIRRVAIVAGGVMSDIPFGALADPRRNEPMGLRFALSDLPCLSARSPLNRRSWALRGDQLLLVQPPAAGITKSRTRLARNVLGPDDPITRECLALALGSHRYRQVRIDTHGQYDHSDPTKSWLALAPGSAGYLRAEDLHRMDLSHCGTVVLGACESGMAKRVGRDERAGFARAAFHAGAASVVAARWVAPEPAAGTLLDNFQRYLGRYPRDIALRRAQVDMYNGRSLAGVHDIRHPAHWACWTLYGDPGWQTGAGPLRRALRRVHGAWR